MGLLKHPDGQKQLEVISNSISIDYVVHHCMAGDAAQAFALSAKRCSIIHLKKSNQIHVTLQLHFKTTKRHFFLILSWEKEGIRNPEKREKILTRWSGQDYPLNMASQSL